MRRAATSLLSRAAASSCWSSCPSTWRVGGPEAIGSSLAATTTPTASPPSPVFRRSLAIPCNLKLGAVPPPPLVVRYTRGGIDAFIELADELEEAVPGLAVEGSEEGEEDGGRGGGRRGASSSATAPSEDGGAITDVLAPGGQVLLSATKGRPVLARDVLSALEKWQQDQAASAAKE